MQGYFALDPLEIQESGSFLSVLGRLVVCAVLSFVFDAKCFQSEQITVLKSRKRKNNPPELSQQNGHDMLLMAGDPIFRFLAVRKSWYLADDAWGQVLLALPDSKALRCISHSMKVTPEW